MRLSTSLLVIGLMSIPASSLAQEISVLDVLMPAESVPGELDVLDILMPTQRDALIVAPTADIPPLAVSFEVEVTAPALRPPSLTQMYAHLIVMQALDVATTVTALNAGHREANPLFQSGSAAKLVAVKAAVTAFNIWAAEKLWKKSPAAAITVMTVANGMMTAVISNNARILGRTNLRSEPSR